MSDLVASKSEINTNMTMVELKGKVVKDLTSMSDEEREYAISMLEKFIINEKRPRLIMLLSNELRYFTTFEIKQADTRKNAEAIVEFLETEELFISLGGLKILEQETDHIEVWIGDKFFALFNYDGFIVEI